MATFVSQWKARSKPLMKTCLLHLGLSSWQWADSDSSGAPVEFSPGTLADQAETIIDGQDHNGQPIVVGLDTSFCLSATVPIASPQMIRRPRAMRYHLEQWIPWSAEEYIVDWAGHRQEAFMVATRHAPLSGLLEKLEQADLPIAAIVPTTLLAYQAIQAAGQLPPEHRFLMQWDGRVELVAVRGGQPYRHSRTAANGLTLLRQLKTEQLAQPAELPLFTSRLDAPLLEALQRASLAPTVLDVAEPLAEAQRGAERILSGKEEPPINLRRDELAGTHQFQATAKEQNRLKWAAWLLVAAAAVALWVLGNRYQQESEQLEGQLATLHESLFPELEPPADVGRAIDQEYRLLVETRTPATELPQSEAVDEVLQHLLGNIPQGLRFRLLEIRLEQQTIFLAGEVRTGADADRIAESLRSAGFEVEPPRIQRLVEKGFSVKLTAKPVPSIMRSAPYTADRRLPGGDRP
jgi:hypothetical protein